MEKFLLHTCCAPCSVAVIEELKDQFNLTVFFYNPNIYPEAEYLKRKAEVIKICKDWQVPMVDADYEPIVWANLVKGLEQEPEGGARCLVCFKARLAKAANFAKENKFDYFGTSLTSGRNKKAEIIHPLAEDLANKFGLKFYAVDWKTNGRSERNRVMVTARGIYRQNYCGCRYSIKDN